LEASAGFFLVAGFFLAACVVVAGFCLLVLELLAAFGVWACPSLLKGNSRHAKIRITKAL
jgi:hypothetical protein